MMYRCRLKDVKWLWWGSFEQVIREELESEESRVSRSKGERATGAAVRQVGDKQEMD